MDLQFSMIIPVYNRPDEMNELLHSLTLLKGNIPFEVVVIEDGSEIKCESIINSYQSKLNLQYFFTENQGAGESRNYGMQKATGNYFIILDSDCIIPENYLLYVKQQLLENYTDAYGGPDAAHDSFTHLQKAINYSMTSFLTTGGIRGKKKGVGKFQLRSFNMGVSKKAFHATNGFSKMKAGEDIDFTFRLWQKGFKTQLIPEAFVYHKRRTSSKQFFKQVFAFGKARPQLNTKYPDTAKLVFWFPTLFLIALVTSILFTFFEICFGLQFFGLYLFAIFLHSSVLSKNLLVGVISVFTTLIQFMGYGTGFLIQRVLQKRD